MMTKTEVFSFVTKFSDLLYAGQKASLVMDCDNGDARVSLEVFLQPDGHQHHRTAADHQAKYRHHHQHVHHPPQYVHHPHQHVRHPPQHVHHPPQYVRHPPQNVQHPPQYVRHPPQHVHHPTYLLGDTHPHSRTPGRAGPSRLHRRARRQAQRGGAQAYPDNRDRRSGHEHPPADRRAGHHPPPERRAGHPPHPPDRRAGHHPPPPDRRAGHPPPPPDRRPGHHPPLPDRRAGHHPPPERRAGHPPHPPDKRAGHHPPPPDRRAGHPSPPPDRRAGHPPPPDRGAGCPPPPPDRRAGNHQPPAESRTCDPPPSPAASRTSTRRPACPLRSRLANRPADDPPYLAVLPADDSLHKAYNPAPSPPSYSTVAQTPSRTPARIPDHPASPAGWGAVDPTRPEECDSDDEEDCVSSDNGEDCVYPLLTEAKAQQPSPILQQNTADLSSFCFSSNQVQHPLQPSSGRPFVRLLHRDFLSNLRKPVKYLKFLLSQNIERAILNRRKGGGWVWKVAVRRDFEENMVWDNTSYHGFSYSEEYVDEDMSDIARLSWGQPKPANEHI